MTSPVTEGYALKEKIAELEQTLLAQHPRMPTLLAEIHTVLQKQPENVTLLSEEEVAIVVNGLKQQTGVQFAQAAVKTATKKGTSSLLKKLKGLDASNF